MCSTPLGLHDQRPLLDKVKVQLHGLWQLLEHGLALGGVAVPLSEDTLATLVQVHIIGGSKDLAKHLPGATMRANTVLELIELLRESGYVGYEETGLSCKERVRNRMRERMHMHCAPARMHA